MVDRVGLQLGNYRLVQMIGQGGFSDVYLGEHIHLNTRAAIKLLQLRLLGSNMEQFRNEARTIASLVYPHIVRVLDFGVEDDIPYLVMDYAPNGTLRQRHPRGTALAPQNIVPYVKQIALALQYAHDRKLIHRDVKPENMLLGSNNEILLSDFGLVLVAQSSGSDMTQEMVGTVPYMAPEQLRGKPRAASDQYALGVVVYEWLSGERPFNGSFVEIASQHILAPPPPLYGRIPGISPTLEQVVFTALDKDPRQRFASVQAFASTLEQVCLPAQPVQFISPNPDMLIPGSESSLPTYVKPLPSESSRPTYVVTPQDQIPQAGFDKPQPAIPSQPTSMVTPPGPAVQAAAMNTPIPGQSSQPTYVATPSNQPVLPLTMAPQAAQPTIPDQATPAPQPGVLVREPGGVPAPPRRRALTWLLAAIISLVLVASIFSAMLFGLRPLFLHSNNTGAGSGLHSSASSSPVATAIVRHASTATPSPTRAPSPPLPQPSPSSLNPTACQSSSTGWTCSVKLSLPSSAPTYINWRTNTSSNLSGVAFSPSSNKLTPGQTQSVSIFVPYGDCFPGSFYFIGINTTTVSWDCTTSPNPSPSPTPMPSPSPSPMPGPSPTPSPSPSPSPSPTPSPSPSPMPSPSPSPMLSPSPTPSATG